MRPEDIVTSKHLPPKHSLPQQAIRKCALLKPGSKAIKIKTWDQETKKHWSKGISQDNGKGKSQDNCCIVALKGKQFGLEQKGGNPGRTDKWPDTVCI